jgi:WD40 repeat protein
MNSVFSPKDDKEFEGFFKFDESRRQQYKFGKGDVVYITPSNYPKEEEYRKENVHGELILEHIYGYKGNTNNSRQNIYLRDGLLLYYNAAVGIVFNPLNKQQHFFTEHSDDITCLCIDPRPDSTLVATGQKDPKDDPVNGKEHPKVYIWDYKTMKSILCIDDICWGSISRMQWSPVTGYLYVLCGDKDQTLKTYDIDTLRKNANNNNKNKIVLSKDVELLSVNSQNTKKLGFLIRPKPCEDLGIKDEIMIYCMNKLQHVQISEDPKKKTWSFTSKISCYFCW